MEQSPANKSESKTRRSSIIHLATTAMSMLGLGAKVVLEDDTIADSLPDDDLITPSHKLKPVLTTRSTLYNLGTSTMSLGMSMFGISLAPDSLVWDDSVNADDLFKDDDDMSFDEEMSVNDETTDVNPQKGYEVSVAH